MTPGITQLSHTYDDASNMLSYANAAQGTSKTFTYDALNRLDTATGPWGFLDYGYDDLGNRLTEIRNAQTTAYTYASNQLDYLTVTPPGTVTDFTYDTVGNQVSDGTLSLTWNDANRMTTSSDGATYFYDGDGPRVKKVTAADTTYYHYGLGGELLAETTSAGVTKEYFRLGGMLVARNDSSDPTSTFAYLHADHQGSIIAVTYPGGGVVCTPDYDPFGADAAPPPPSCSPVRYTGRLVDDGTGLYDLGARYYDPAIGRFISPDAVLGELTTPKTLNKYAYALGNPLMYVDETGHEVQFADDLDVNQRSAIIDDLNKFTGNTYGIDKDSKLYLESGGSNAAPTATRYYNDLIESELVLTVHGDYGGDTMIAGTERRGQENDVFIDMADIAGLVYHKVERESFGPGAILTHEFVHRFHGGQSPGPSKSRGHLLPAETHGPSGRIGRHCSRLGPLSGRWWSASRGASRSRLRCIDSHGTPCIPYGYSCSSTHQPGFEIHTPPPGF